MGTAGPALDTRPTVAILCASATLLAATALAGHLTGSARLAAVLTAGRPIAMVTALAMAAAAAALALARSPGTSRRLASRGLAAAVAVTGAVELLRAWRLGPEVLAAVADGPALPFHPYPSTSLLLLLLGTAVASHGSARGRVAAHVLGTAAAAACTFVLLGYIFREPTFVDAGMRLVPVIAATLGLLAVAVAVLVAEPVGWVRLLVSRTSAGAMARLLVPAVVLVPLVGAFIARPKASGEAPRPLAQAVVAGFDMALVLGITLVAGAVLQRKEERASELARAVEAERTALRDAQRSVARLAAIVESSDDAILAKTPDGTITSWNRGAERLYGYAAGEALGRHATMLAPAERRDEIATILARVRRGERVESYETVRRRRDGGEIHVSLTVSPILDESGALAGISSIARDVGDRVRAEQAIRRVMTDLERSNRELEQFAYVASHDLQEPLRMVSSYTQLLARRYADRLDQDAHDFIGYAVDGASHMQRLIHDLLQYSRVGTRGRQPAPTDSNAAFGRALVDLGAAIAEAGALVTHDELPTVVADEIQLAQLFQNLVGNGLKFRRPGEPPRVHVSARRDGGEWCFAVRDDGIGIAPEYHARLFVIFQRLHGRDEYPGTGIGLAICKRIVERHGGRIWIESEADRGSTFRFTLPAVPGREC